MTCRKDKEFNEGHDLMMSSSCFGAAKHVREKGREKKDTETSSRGPLRGRRRNSPSEGAGGDTDRQCFLGVPSRLTGDHSGAVAKSRALIGEGF